MTKWLLLSVFLITTHISSATIVGGEYFFNTDPGVGNGTQITILTPVNDADLDLNISIPESLPLGVNYLYIRFLDDNGQWSHTTRRPFYKEEEPINSVKLMALEYFIDEAVAPGNGTPLAVDAGASSSEVQFNMQLSGLSAGAHYLYVRAQNQDGEWGIATKRVFFVEEELAKPISELEYYYFNDQFTSGKYVVNLNTPGTELMETFEGNTAELVKNETYTLNVVAIDVDGVRSSVASHSFVFDNATSAYPHLSSKAIVIAPNPVVNEICLNADAEYLLNHSYQIVSSNGAVVKKGLLSSDKIAVAELGTGTYILIVSNKEGIIFSDFFIKK
ncbi:T9SS type A sorting domain-containing protein [Carboxylicivirga linearis]|uniref:T9SS type A sorting domain-containing protein n=1 Tax=Carboxylicivirga linearis TaxID=1628157 RepID=A0ABS5JYM1_9BACT|nr:T9SS type A sorting domain-containing protein [Carboxylicivirga linearis]MBS2100017.1 T9SS type A sorting domain-containing protein [Carboxylicivirga linearis]